MPSSDGAFAPKSLKSVLGWSAAQVCPRSVGTGARFSLAVNVDHERARAGIEQQLGKPMTCATGDGVRSCEVKLGSKKTAVLLTDLNGRAQSSLIGCYYFYLQ